MSVERRVASFLRLADADLDAAEILARVGNHYAAYHVQQALEKHRLEVLADRLPEGDPWAAKLQPWLRYTPFATTFRYPKPGGGVPEPPTAKTTLDDVALLRQLFAAARAELGAGGGP